MAAAAASETLGEVRVMAGPTRHPEAGLPETGMTELDDASIAYVSGGRIILPGPIYPPIWWIIRRLAG